MKNEVKWNEMNNNNKENERIRKNEKKNKKNDNENTREIEMINDNDIMCSDLISRI